MAISASQRAALRRRKDLQKKSIVESDDQISDVRQAIVAKLSQELNNSNDLATLIEQQLFEDYAGVGAEYRAAFRRLLISLKTKSTGFAQRIIVGDLSPREFAAKNAEDLKSKTLKIRDQKLKERGLRESVAKEMLPENIQQIHDGRDREKWGVSRSAAAIDD